MGRHRYGDFNTDLKSGADGFSWSRSRLIIQLLALCKCQLSLSFPRFLVFCFISSCQNITFVI